MKVRTEADAVLAIREKWAQEARLAAAHEDALEEDFERGFHGPPLPPVPWAEIVAKVPEGYCDSYAPAPTLHAHGDGDLSTFGTSMRRGT